MSEQYYYHINTKPAYSDHPFMQPGSTYSFTNDNTNPFFQYYERFPDPESILLPQLGKDNKISGIDSLFLFQNLMGNLVDLPRKAFVIANHYRLLARELVLEKVRQEKFPSSPSRQNCIFLIESEKDIQSWKNQVGINGKLYQVIKVRATGNIIRVDSNNLPKGNEPFSEWESKAYNYWNCEPTDDPSIEVLLEGQVTVDEILEMNM